MPHSSRHRMAAWSPAATPSLTWPSPSLASRAQIDMSASSATTVPAPTATPLMAEPPERYCLGEGLPQLRPRERREQRGVGGTGADAVDPDLVACHLPGERLG